jgi:hypothetical protein
MERQPCANVRQQAVVISTLPRLIWNDTTAGMS